MDINRILAAVDHTLLAQDAVWEQVKTLCDDGLRCHTASVCIPPSFVRQAKDYVGDRLAVCTVIGFPNGYSTTAVKCFETEDAVQNGADEIDMVINLGWVKEQNWDALRHFRPPGRGGFPEPGRVPAGRQPDCQGGQGRRIVPVPRRSSLQKKEGKTLCLLPTTPPIPAISPKPS